MKKVVIISSVFYPRNTPRANRATELAKELGRRGYDVTVYALLGDYDYSVFENEYNLKVLNLGRNRFSNFNSSEVIKIKKTNKIRKIWNKILQKTIEYPEIGLIELVFKVLKRERSIDLLITIALPYPLHWGVGLYRSFFKKSMKSVTWVADCGDPYMGNAISKKLFYFKYLEQMFCSKADFISIPVSGAKDAYYTKHHNKFVVIPQGFEFDNINYKEFYKKNDVITFIYAGGFYNKIRDPRPLLDLLSRLPLDFKFVVYTRLTTILDEYKVKLGSKLEVHDYIERSDLLEAMSKADFLVNLENNTDVQVPSKLIDYSLVGRPILSINSSKELDEELVMEFLSQNYTKGLVIEDVEQYDIKNVAEKFINLL